MIPFLYTAAQTGVSVAWFGQEIKHNCSFTKDEIENILRAGDIQVLKDAVNQFSFSKARKTHQGYYAIIGSSDGYQVFLFFNRITALKTWMFCSSFMDYEEGKSNIQTLTQYFDGSYADNPIPHQRLNTGAEYQVYFFKDRMVNVLYGDFEEHEDKEVMHLVKMTPFSYETLRWNPLYRFDELYRDVVYIKKIDRK